MNRIAGDIRVCALVKGIERYVFMYDALGRDEAMRTLARFAANPDLSFTWYDAAVMSKAIRGELATQEGVNVEEGQ